MSDVQSNGEKAIEEADAQPESEGRRCVFSTLSFLVVPCAIVLWIGLFLGVSAYALYFLAPLLITSSLLSSIGSCVATSSLPSRRCAFA